MVVQHNLQAMNANRMLGITTDAQGKSTEKLSSGYRINRAADDAAGLSISEKMRKQIRGLTRASDNAQDGISCVQTAEGALSEVTAMLQRMNELAIQSANGTNSEDDRTAIQDEIKQLTTEIDRIAETTKFNETYLLKGVGDSKYTTSGGQISGATKAGKVIPSTLENATGNKYEGIISSTLGKGTLDTFEITYTDKLGESQTAKIEFTIGEDDNETAANIAKAVNEDEDLNIIFNATTGEDGRLFLESKRNYYELQELSNGASAYQLVDVTFGSSNEGGEDKLKTLMYNPKSGVTNKEATHADNKECFYKTDAKGDTYSIDFTKLKDGSTVTIDGVTYTFDSKNSDGTKANTFKNIEELQALLGGAYDVSGVVGFVGKKYSTAGAKSINGVNTTYDIVSETAIATATIPTNAVATDGLKLVPDTLITLSPGASEGQAGLSTGADISTDTKMVPRTLIVADTDYTETSDMSFSIKITRKKQSEESKTTASKEPLELRFHVGADSADTNKITVKIDAMDASTIGIRDKDGNSIDLSTEESATKSIDTIAAALKVVSAQRSALGAAQNRLEHTIANLDNIVENTTAAESAIRDTDMAEEMVQYSKNNILAQAGQSMLAQANQSTQGVTTLLG
ncbi:flagellin [Acetitomaculum ruminis DSM 5522]|uniref:Flagellin n=1 Tax=Acetitomaculum ruminis DSM 5522 TaxID=1120918 RepID=A0A1I0YME4_9FIRM|nr:flagellin [Acetitomaculum ruminis]SFB13640.1 flagellin [Acetitomaculum ruminis DSM 5522]